MKLIGSASGGGTAWLDAAKALAHGVATEGAAAEGNADPLVRIQLDELARVAELHVADATGLAVGSGEHPISFAPLGRGAWALRVLDAWQPLVEKLVAGQRSAPSLPPGLLGSEPGDDLVAGGGLDAGMADMLGRFAATLGPLLTGLQFGSAAGHLAQRALGQYTLPLPWPPSDELVVVPENIAAFARDWSLPEDQTRLWVCIHELTAHAVLSRPHVAKRIRDLIDEATADAVGSQQQLLERLTGEQLDPEALQRMVSDPEALLGDLLSPEQERVSANLVAVTSALGGYVDHVTTRVATTLIGSTANLAEAWYRYRIEGSDAEALAASLFGLAVGRQQVDRGAAFVRGVVERAGEDGLAKLWGDVKNLPTPAELDAPGLWLERISLPDQLG